ncbi:MAG: methyltransferase domain-containing protein [Patescibacteria group bacterium]|jgi:2-polyprenyl-3-methyl-5-hydroxy-6-metoxy-1,4-benzoquinol methylase|nr:methyltransferase domain-containing protein [Patescibacteria group bacterium]
MKNKNVKKLRKVVKDNYQEIAKDFNLTRKKYIWPELENLSKQVFDKSKVLDAGCGNGRLLEALKDKDIEYLGFDNSEELLKLARENYKDFSFKNLDIFNLEEIKDNYYDFIFLIAVIIHVPGKENRIKVIKELSKKLNKDGKIILSTWNILEGKKYRKIVFRNRIKNIFSFNGLEKNDLLFPWKNNQGEEISQRFYHAFSKSELLEIGKKSGLEMESCYKDKYNFWLILKK